jgi:hypothetical protein
MHATKIMIPVLGLWLGGCAIHPLPQDVTGYSTYHIVEKIRCETRDALTALAVRGLRESTWPETLELARRLELSDRLDSVPSERLTIVDLFKNPKLARQVDPQVHGNFDIFALSAIGFDFSLIGTENNDASAGANFGWPFVDGGFTLNVGGGLNRQRQNERKLIANHTFLELYQRTSPEVCRKIETGAGNLIYPLVGKIGIEELINTFYLLNRPHNERLKHPVEVYDAPVKEAYRTKEGGGDIKALTDTLEFTTTISGGATPSVTLDPIPNRLRLASATASVSAKREDVHKVSISIEKGTTVTSITHALSLAGLIKVTEPGRQAAKQQTYERLRALRTEEFFTRQREISKRLGLPPL